MGVLDRHRHTMLLMVSMQVMTMHNMVLLRVLMVMVAKLMLNMLRILVCRVMLLRGPQRYSAGFLVRTAARRCFGGAGAVEPRRVGGVVVQLPRSAAPHGVEAAPLRQRVALELQKVRPPFELQMAGLGLGAPILDAALLRSDAIIHVAGPLRLLRPELLETLFQGCDELPMADRPPIDLVVQPALQVPQCLPQGSLRAGQEALDLTVHHLAVRPGRRQQLGGLNFAAGPGRGGSVLLQGRHSLVLAADDQSHALQVLTHRSHPLPHATRPLLYLLYLTLHIPHERLLLTQPLVLAASDSGGVV
mmetsp:Transcript_111705/g.322874  ORF Transcript_111705/g.322874 Transcript_111705/m.322874 type:complete len:304 (-) Transcript_111705:685-1596(-)